MLPVSRCIDDSPGHPLGPLLVVDEQEAGRMVVGGIGIAADGVAVAAVGRALKCSIRSNQIKSRNKDISALVKHVVPVLSPLGQKNISLLF